MRNRGCPGCALAATCKGIRSPSAGHAERKISTGRLVFGMRRNGKCALSKRREETMGSDSPDHSGMSRRETLAGLSASLLATPASAQLAVAPPSSEATQAYAYVGSFTSAERKARGNGINVYQMDTATGA